MAQLAQYAKVNIFVNGSPLLEEADIKMSRNSGLIPVLNLSKGFAGFTFGAADMQIEISGGVPAAGFEYNSGADMLQGNIVQLTLTTDSSQLTTNGFVIGDDISQSVNSDTKLSIRFHTEFADWQNK